MVIANCCLLANMLEKFDELLDEYYDNQEYNRTRVHEIKWLPYTGYLYMNRKLAGFVYT